MKKSASRGDWRFGIHAVEAALADDDVQEVVVCAANQRARDIEGNARRAGIAVQRVSATELDRRFPGQRHQGVACRVALPSYHDQAWLEALIEDSSDVFLLILDQIQDPRNFGACLRTAEAAGVHAVVFTKDRSAQVTAVAAKAAAGAASRLPLVQVTNLASCMDMLKGRNVWLTGADASADKRHDEMDFRGAIAIVMGNEGRGLRRLTRERCDFLASIPMAGATESLNVSVATGILLFEAVRQRRN